MAHRWTCFYGLFVLTLASVNCKTYYVEKDKDVKMTCDLPFKDVMKWNYQSSLILTIYSNGRSNKGTAPMVSRSSSSGNKLTVKRVAVEDSGSYECVVGSDVQKSQLYVVNVSSTPASPVLVGTKVKFHCQAEGTIKPTWLKMNGKPYNPDVTSPVTLSDAGKWECEFKSYEEQHVFHIQIDILGMADNSTEVKVGRGMAATLPCVLSNPLNDYKLRSLKLQSGGWKLLNPETTLITLEGVPFQDGKMLSWSKPTGLSPVQVTPKDVTYCDFSLTLKNAQAGEYQCWLDFGDKGTLKRTVKLVLDEQAGDESAPDPIQSGNKIHKKGSASSGKLLGLSLWIWVAIGTSCVFVIGAVIVAVVLYKRKQRNKKRRMRKRRSMKQPLTAKDYCQCNRVAGRPNGKPTVLASPPQQQLHEGPVEQWK